jgi:hypothetical protein
MPSFSIGFDLKREMWHGVEKFASKDEQWYQPYTQLLQDLNVKRQVWYLCQSEWPNVPDRVIIYTEAASPSVMQDFCSTLASQMAPDIARKCKDTCQVGTTGTEWNAAPPEQNFRVIFNWPS